MTCNADKRIYLDSETCGLHSIMVLLQYALEDGEIVMYDVWKHTVGETLDLIEWICEHTVVGFNLTFDWFHVVKIYTIWSLCPRDWIPEEHIDEIAMLEPKAQSGPCVKPANALDLLLHSRKGPYQSLMARSDIRIRRVPKALAYALAGELESRVQIDGIYFARNNHDPNAPRWQVFDIKNRDGRINPDFSDVVLRFHPAGGLKYLAEHALGHKPKYHYEDVEPDARHLPKELGYAPTALAISKPSRNWEVRKTDAKGVQKVVGYAWPGVVKHFIEHWATREDAREYARDDIVYTRELAQHFAKLAGVEQLPAGDDDSILSCMVPVIRWRGFTIDVKGIKKLLKEIRAVIDSSPVNINKPPEVRAWIGEAMDDMEKVILESSTKKANLIAVSKWALTADEECTKCDGKGRHDLGHCHRCGGTGTMSASGKVTEDCGNHPAALRARQILEVKIAKKQEELYKKLLRAKKLHASFKVIGTLSTRMSGGDGLNAQGINRSKEIRKMFPLAWDGFELCGGDFDSFEVTLADAVYNDPQLRQALLGGKKLHGLFGMCMYPGYTYEQIIASEGTDNDMYAPAKSGVFALIYGGDWKTLVTKFGISEEIARAAEERFFKMFPDIKKARDRTFKAFCSMAQPDGTQVIWGEPADYVESFLGFRRYFTLENKITKALYELSKKLPKAWRQCKVKVIRNANKGVQVAGGAVCSALYGAAFQIQAANQRAAANHEIQSPGGEITKNIQRRVWDLQPCGIHELIVAPMNIHDELECVTHPDYVEAVVEAVRTGVESYRDKVPLIGMKWFKRMENWAEKKAGEEAVHIKSPLMMAA